MNTVPIGSPPPHAMNPECMGPGFRRGDELDGHPSVTPANAGIHEHRRSPQGRARRDES